MKTTASIMVLALALHLPACHAYLSPSFPALSSLRFGASVCNVAISKNVQLCKLVPKNRNLVADKLTMQSDTYDLLVIGGGPVGITAALVATAAGRTVALVDGTPKNLVPFTGPTGIFSKALRDTAMKVDVNTLRTMGLHDNVVWNQVQQQTNAILTGNGYKNMGVLQSKHIPFIRGQAAFVDSNTLKVEQEDSSAVNVRAKNILVATGSTAYRIPDLPYDDLNIFDSDTIKKLSFLPKSVTIIGAGLIGIEYARIFSRLQCRVTMIVRQNGLDVALKRIGIDRDVGIQLQKDLNLNKVRIIFNAQVSKVVKPPVPADQPDARRALILQLTTADGKPHPTPEIRSEVLMTATGRYANTKGLGLDRVGVKLDSDGWVIVDGNLQTHNPSIYAAGDVLGAPGLASVGIEQANALVRHLEGRSITVKGTWGAIKSSGPGPDGYDPRSLLSNPLKYPVSIWTIPEMSYIGYTKENAAEKGINAGDSTANYNQIMRAGVQGIKLGMLKLVYEKPSGRIIGVHILGEDAAELIHYGTALAQSGKTVFELAGANMAAVTFHELFKVAAISAVQSLEWDSWNRIVEGINVHDGRLHVSKIAPALDKAGLVPQQVQRFMRDLNVGTDMVSRDFLLQRIHNIYTAYSLPPPA